MKTTKKSSKKRAAKELDTPALKEDKVEIGDGVVVEQDLNEQTMGEKLATLTIVPDDNKVQSQSKEEDSTSSLDTKPPSADSVQILLKQALHADDRALLFDCLYTQDEKVIAKSVSQLNPDGVFKLLKSLVSLIESRGAILVCALPWLRSLLLQHASGIVSQESSLTALNSLYQLIESRVSTFHSALRLSSVIDVLYAGVDGLDDENDTVGPVVFEDNDEEESEDAMDTEENEEKSDAELGGVDYLSD